jgi:hypothetical protein
MHPDENHWQMVGEEKWKFGAKCSAFDEEWPQLFLALQLVASVNEDGRRHLLLHRRESASDDALREANIETSERRTSAAVCGLKRRRSAGVFVARDGATL